ncbi:unnamed protein product [Rotaria sordida]|uniref:Uncharacterized protein n=1 Tax=Rotaria sordida TaxID=392033 RepID=A0A815JJ32_9BILA|nr:unnamed protein product [Rotaria sordida]CAF1059901.1 unnamed protein product [Rotaria sordida]CAF1367051.1 unnamed protein product [Rotaria sordida]CAF1381819.1 unnamed protein product [Rotaria sordida]CAF3750197.1 unnamed protein product [Rotaria sordida]
MPSHVTDVEGDWKIVDYPQHPDCVNCQIEIKGYGLDPNVFKLDMDVTNHLTCILKHNSTTNQWAISDFSSTEIGALPEEMYKEDVLRNLISGLQKLEVQDEHQLIIKTNNGEQVRLERLL